MPKSRGLRVVPLGPPRLCRSDADPCRREIAAIEPTTRCKQPEQMGHGVAPAVADAETVPGSSEGTVAPEGLLSTIIDTLVANGLTMDGRGSYLSAARGDLARAIDLDGWNAAGRRCPPRGRGTRRGVRPQRARPTRDGGARGGPPRRIDSARTVSQSARGRSDAANAGSAHG